MAASSVDLHTPCPLPPSLSHLDKLSPVSRVPGVKGQALGSMQELRFPVWRTQLSFVLPPVSTTQQHSSTAWRTPRHQQAEGEEVGGDFMSGAFTAFLPT